MVPGSDDMHTCSCAGRGEASIILCYSYYRGKAYTVILVKSSVDILIREPVRNGKNGRDYEEGHGSRMQTLPPAFQRFSVPDQKLYYEYGRIISKKGQMHAILNLSVAIPIKSNNPQDVLMQQSRCHKRCCCGRHRARG